VRSLYVMGTLGCGKTAVCLGLARKFTDSGYKVAYFKPVGAGAGPEGRDDEDAVLMKTVLGMEEGLDEIVLLRSSPHFLTKYREGRAYLEEIAAAYQKIASRADIVIIEGPTSAHLMVSLGLDAPTIASKLGALTLMVNRAENDFSLDTTISYCEYVRYKGAEVAGVIFNNVPRTLLEEVRGVYRPILDERGFPVFGVVPKMIEISAPTAQEFHDALGGELLVGENCLDSIIEDVFVGAMTLESAISYLRRATNKALITGGDRADLALAAIETGASIIILTGGLYPHAKVIARAAERGVPIVLVHYDTYTTIERLREVSRRIRPTDARGIEMATDNLNANCDWKAILTRLAG
jgi:BioD-like phosphotransacetylase family protein